jgi:hypothetical protein
MALLDEVLPSGVAQKINANSVKLSFTCQRSSVAEQRFRKPPVVGSSPTAGFLAFVYLSYL